MAAFNSMAGGQGSAIAAAMARRGMGSGGTAQQSPGSAGFTPGLMPPPAPTGSGMPVSIPQAATSQQATPQTVSAQPTAMGMTTNDSALIIKALTAKLDSESKIKERQMGIA